MCSWHTSGQLVWMSQWTERWMLSSLLVASILDLSPLWMWLFSDLYLWHAVVRIHQSGYGTITPTHVKLLTYIQLSMTCPVLKLWSHCWMWPYIQQVTTWWQVWLTKSECSRFFTTRSDVSDQLSCNTSVQSGSQTVVNGLQPLTRRTSTSLTHTLWTEYSLRNDYPLTTYVTSSSVRKTLVSHWPLLMDSSHGTQYRKMAFWPSSMTVDTLTGRHESQAAPCTTPIWSWWAQTAIMVWSKCSTIKTHVCNCTMDVSRTAQHTWLCRHDILSKT